MAIQVDKVFESGITVKGCYLKIVNLSGNKNGVAINLGAFLDKETSDSGKPSIENQEFYFTPDTNEGANEWLTQGYDFLKTLHEFSNAVDVLEEGQSSV
ncbi:hypothetical protein [Planococcus rifietoensis]|uniref:hypothetical protein n=1 Tax=Planococcus rifietoensis TaxID=200991 RepID=UPI00384C1E24